MAIYHEKRPKAKAAIHKTDLRITVRLRKRWMIFVIDVAFVIAMTQLADYL